MCNIDIYDVINAIIKSGNKLGIGYSHILSGYVVVGAPDTYQKFSKALMKRIEVLMRKGDSKIIEDEIE